MDLRAPPRRRGRFPVLPWLVVPVVLLACEPGPTGPAPSPLLKEGETPPGSFVAHSGLIRACHGPDGAPFYRIGASGLLDRCRSPRHVEVAWPVDGPPGPIGPPGPRGATGFACWDQDRDGTTDPEEDLSGDGNFDALDCQGPPGVFDGTLASPNGEYSLVIDDDGIRLQTPGAILEIEAGRIRLAADGRVAVEGNGLGVQADATVGLTSSGTLSLDAGLVQADALLIHLNGDCQALARVNDAHSGHIVVGGFGLRTPVPGVILTGSPTVRTC